MKKPKLEDFYDESDPRGCSTSEYSEYIRALSAWEKNSGVNNLFNQDFGYSLGDTLVTGVEFTLKDGTKEYQEINPPIVYKTAEENNKKE